MTFTPKSWKNKTQAETTPITAAALIDVETRLSAYTDTFTGTPLTTLRDWSTGAGSDVVGMAIDATYIYTANHMHSTTARDQINRIPLATGIVEESFIKTSEVHPQFGIAVDATKIYWQQANGNIARAAIGGGSLELTWAKPTEMSIASGFAITGGFLYFLGSENIGRVNTTTGVVTNNWAVVPKPSFLIGGVCTDGEYLYYSVGVGLGSYPPWTMGRVKLDATGINNSFVVALPDGGFTGELGNSLSTRGPATHLYWAAIDFDNGIGRCAMAGTGVEREWVKSIEGERIKAQVGDSGHIYWASCGHGSIGRWTA